MKLQLNREKVSNWFDSLATFDAMSSLANFAYNHQDYVYPEPVSGDFGLFAENLGHPLIAEEYRVVNNIEIKGWNQFAIIFGMLVIYFVNWFIARSGDSQWLVTEGWRWMCFSGVIPSGIFLLLLFFVPETPRFLVMKGKDEDA